MARLQELAREKVELELTPMIDVTFLLLIFFLCTLKFKTLEGKLAAYLPKDVGVNPSQVEPREAIDLRLRVALPGTKLTQVAPGQWRPYSGSGRFAYGADRVLRYTIGPRQLTDLASVEQRLAELHALDPERELKIDPGAGTIAREVVEVLDAALAVGLDSVRIVGDWPAARD